MRRAEIAITFRTDNDRIAVERFSLTILQMMENEGWVRAITGLNF